MQQNAKRTVDVAGVTVTGGSDGSVNNSFLVTLNGKLMARDRNWKGYNATEAAVTALGGVNDYLPIEAWVVGVTEYASYYKSHYEKYKDRQRAAEKSREVATKAMTEYMSND